MGNTCRRHFTLRDFKLEHDRPEDFVHSVLFTSAMPYAALVSCMCLYAVTMVFYSALNSVYGEKILIWLTYWSFYMVTARVTITSLNAWIFVFRTVRYQRRKSTHKSPPDRRVEEGSGLPVMYKLQWLLQNVSSCSAIIVSLLYWTLLYSGENSPTMISVNSHAVNSVFVLTDLLLSRAPIRIQHFIYTVVFFLVYVLFSIIYWAAGGQNHRGENYIYSLLDYSDKPGRAVAVNFAVVLVVCPLIQLFLYGLFRLRQWFWGRCGTGRSMDGSLYIGRERNENVTGRETDRNSGKLGGSGSGSGSGSEMNGGRLSGVSVRTRDTKSGFPEVDYVNAPDDDPEAMIDVDLDFEMDDVVQPRPTFDSEISTTDSTKALL